MDVIRAAVVAATLAVAGCATTIFNPASNAPLERGTPHGMGAPLDIVGPNAVALSFSGGGLRAAAFSHGVLQALESLKTPEGDLLDDVTFISSVSGGSLTAAYYGVNGRQGLARYREQVLLHDFERGMRLSPMLPWNLARVLGGGLNAREDFGEGLDTAVFRGATFADIYRNQRPEIRIHATDLYHRVAFPFIPQVFSMLCSDLSRYSVADAVAASMAVPLVFAPVVLRTYPQQCDMPLPPALERIRGDPDAPRLAKSTESGLRAYHDAKHAQYIKLVDGGFSDNYGLSTLIVSRLLRGTPYAPLSERDALRIRRLLFIVVDASRGPAGDWSLREAGPEGMDLVLSVADAAVDAAARLAVDGFGKMVREWEAAVIDYRCRLTHEQVARLGGPEPWHCSDVKFSLAFLSIDNLPEAQRLALEAIPTRLTLDAAQIDLAIEGGRAGTLALPKLREYLEQRIGPRAPPVAR